MQEQPQNEDEQKLIAVINSCETVEHYLAALEMADLFITKHQYGNGYRLHVLEKLKTLRGE